MTTSTAPTTTPSFHHNHHSVTFHHYQDLPGVVLLHNFLPSPHSDSIFEALRNSAKWQQVKSKGGDLPRLVCNQANATTDGTIPIYRHPVDEEIHTHPLSKAPCLVLKTANQFNSAQSQFNHVYLQFYRNGEDCIGSHSDKTLDLHHFPLSLIGIYTVGAQRTLRFQNKLPGSKAIKLPISHNSLLLMNLQTNRDFKHFIKPDKRPSCEKSVTELAFGGQRISLTLRCCRTFMNPITKMLSGQGALKQPQSIEEQRQRMIEAFSAENRESISFDRKKHYGNGFSILCVTEGEERK